MIQISAACVYVSTARWVIVLSTRHNAACLHELSARIPAHVDNPDAIKGLDAATV